MTAALIALGYAYLLWLLFLVVMALMHAHQRGVLPPLALVLAVPAIILAVLLDIGLNLVATIPFADRPQEITFSQRMGRYKQAGTGWRAAVARWICANLLDPFDIGGHCRG